MDADLVVAWIQKRLKHILNLICMRDSVIGVAQNHLVWITLAELIASYEMRGLQTDVDFVTVHLEMMSTHVPLGRIPTSDRPRA
jgi:hypothetical protein